MTKDDEEDDNLEVALDVVAKRVERECSEIDYQRHTYNTSSILFTIHPPTAT